MVHSCQWTDSAPIGWHFSVRQANAFPAICHDYPEESANCGIGKRIAIQLSEFGKGPDGEYLAKADHNAKPVG
jgi:hypothetical protein